MHWKKVGMRQFQEDVIRRVAKVVHDLVVYQRTCKKWESDTYSNDRSRVEADIVIAGDPTEHPGMGDLGGKGRRTVGCHHDAETDNETSGDVCRGPGVRVSGGPF